MYEKPRYFSVEIDEDDMNKVRYEYGMLISKSIDWDFN